VSGLVRARSSAWLGLLRRALPVVALGDPKSELSELRDPIVAYLVTRWINKNLHGLAPHRFDYGVGGILGYFENWIHRVNGWGGEIHIFITNKGGVLDEETLEALERCYPWWGSYFEGTCLAMRSFYTMVVSDDAVDLGWVFKHANKLIMDLNNVLNYYERGEITAKIDGQKIELPKAQMMALTEYIVDCRTHTPTPIKPIAVYIPRLLMRYHVKGRMLANIKNVKDRDISNILSDEIDDIEYLPSWADTADDPRLRSSPNLWRTVREIFPTILSVVIEATCYEKIKKIACALVDYALRHGEDIESVINAIQRYIPEEIYIVVDDKEYHVEPSGELASIKRLIDHIKYLDPMVNNYYRELFRGVSINLVKVLREGGGGQAEERGLDVDPELEEILRRKAQSMAKSMDEEGREDVDEEYLEELRRRTMKSRRKRRAEDELGDYDVYGDPHSILDT
jgi:hypothetical protein